MDCLCIEPSTGNAEAKGFKKTILIDLDGVLNTYSGNFNPEFIPPVKNGALEFVKNLSDKFDIKIFTTRNKILATKWVIENGFENFVSDITNIKEIAWLYIDDRCITFDGNFNNLINKIENFEPWHNAKG